MVWVEQQQRVAMAGGICLQKGLGVDAVVQLEDSVGLKAGNGMMHRPDRAVSFLVYVKHMRQQ